MAFERSTPLAKSSREPVKKPFIPRGHLNIKPEDVIARHADGTVTVSSANAEFRRTYHRASLVGEDAETGWVTILATPSTVVTWDCIA